MTKPSGFVVYETPNYTVFVHNDPKLGYAVINSETGVIEADNRCLALSIALARSFDSLLQKVSEGDLEELAGEIGELSEGSLPH